MDWWKWLVGTGGVILLGAFGSALWDAAKTGGRLARDWQARQAERSQAQAQATAARLAADTQRLVMWMGMMTMAVLGMLCLSVTALGLGHCWRGDWAVWAGPTVGALIATRFAFQAMKTLTFALDALISEETRGSEAERLTPHVEAATQAPVPLSAADPAPSPEDARQSHGS